MSQVTHVDDASFESEVIQANLPVLVDFSAAWCGPCKKLEPLIEEIAGEYGERLKVVKVNVDNAPATAAKFGVLSVPTVIFFRDGTVKDQLLGLVPKRMLTDKIDGML